MSTKCFYIPDINLMHVRLNDTVKALCYGITRGYFETNTLADMLEIIDALKDLGVTLVFNVDKVKVADTRVVYRQRVFFTKFDKILDVCVKYNCNINCVDDIALSEPCYRFLDKDMPYLIKYADKLNMDVETWLVLVFKYYCTVYLQAKHIEHLSLIDDSCREELVGVKGLLDRAPYFLSVCDIKNKHFVVLQHFDVCNEQLYTIIENGTTSMFSYGFTNLNVMADKKQGLFVKGKKHEN